MPSPVVTLSFHELTQEAKARVASHHYQDIMAALDAVIGKVFTPLERAKVYQSTVTAWRFTYDGDRVEDEGLTDQLETI